MQSAAQAEPVDLSSLPDPRPSVAQSVAVTRRLADVVEGASRRFAQAGRTVEDEVAEWRQQSRVLALDTAHLAHRVGTVIDHVDGLAAALAAADLQHDSNITVLATFERAFRQLKASTVPSEVRAASGYQDRTHELIVADGDLRQVINQARTLQPSFIAAAHRIAVAAARLGREQLVGEVARQLANARLALNVAHSLRPSHDEAERPLRALVDRLGARTGIALPLPDIIWPPTGKGGDPFAPPSLKDA